MANGIAIFGIIEGLPEKDGIPLVQDAYKRSPAMWKLPGGRVEIGESPAIALYRELMEEIGIITTTVADEDLIFSMNLENHIFAVYRAYYYDGEFGIYSDEIQKAGIFSFDELKNLLSRKEILPNHAAAIERYLAGKETLAFAEKLSAKA